MNSSGIADGHPLPTEFGPGKNERWSVPVGAGHSSPCLGGDAIYLTTFDEQSKQLRVVCLGKHDGALQWQRAVSVDKLEKGHPSFNPERAATTDGSRVVAYFGSYGLLCYDRKGKKLWERRMPLTRSFAGNATSPMIVGKRVILYRGNHVGHFLLALDKETGDELWKVPQEVPFTDELACTACPIVVGDTLIAHMARAVKAFAVDNGQLVWEVKCATTATSTPVVAGNDVLVAAWNKMGEPALRPRFPRFGELVADHDKSGNGLIEKEEFPRLMIFHRPDGAEAPLNGGSIRFRYADRNNDQHIDAEEWEQRLAELAQFRARYEQHGLLAIPLDSQGDVSKSEVRVLASQGIPEVPSPITADGVVYLVKNGGVLTCVDVATGKRTARVRTGGKGTHYASPVLGDGKLYTIAGDGRISVLTLGAKPKLLAVNAMPAPTYATPAIADGVLYVRTHQRLHAFALSAD